MIYPSPKSRFVLKGCPKIYNERIPFLVVTLDKSN
jgi:hypothetical protein